MRVIAGNARGLRLESPVGSNVRPTTDRVKESLFNIINPYIMDGFMLDLFCGSGALGIESLSRGANSCVFVDLSKNSIQTTKNNIALAKCEDKSIVMNEDVMGAINKLGLRGDKFDIIFMDPPYLKDFIEPVLSEISRRKILDLDGIIVIEHDAKDIIVDNVGSLVKYREKKYGKTKLSFFEWEEGNE